MTNYEYNVYRNKQKRIERAKRKRALRRKRRIMISALILAVLISVPTFFYSAKAKTLHQDTYPVYTAVSYTHLDVYKRQSFKSISENESLARLIISSFVLPLNPTIDELNDIKTSVSEAVTNSIIHAYNNEDNHLITMEAFIRNREVTIKIIDDGIGIKAVSYTHLDVYKRQEYKS